MTFFLAWLLAAFVFPTATQQNTAVTGGLRIVVLQGEGAVNVLQQKTAVRALVEVRDPNNLPVAGATVNFSIASQDVAGAQSITVVTNATGQAALTGATPLTSGALKISVHATFNGLTATTSITQTVVTAVAAKAPTGGRSIERIAAIAGGAVAVVGGIAASGGGDDSSNGDATAGLLPSCEFAVSPGDFVVANEGATVALTVVMKNGPCNDQSWAIDVSNAASWISSSPRAGALSGPALLFIAPYVATPSAPNRVATIVVAYQRVTISQPFR